MPSVKLSFVKKLIVL